MTVEGQITGTVMEIGTKEVGIGMKKQKEERWTTFGEEEREQLVMLEDDGINMTKKIREEEEGGVDVDIAMRVDIEEEEEVADMVAVGVEVVMGTMEDMEETMMDTVKTTEAMVEMTEGMVETTEGLVEVAMMEVTEETVVDMEETMGVMEEMVEETMGVMEEVVEDLAIVVGLVDKVDMGEAWVAPEAEEWEVQGVEVAGQERGRGVRKRWVKWVQRGQGRRWGLLEMIPGMLELGPNR